MIIKYKVLPGGNKNMNNDIRDQVHWLIDNLFTEVSQDIAISIVYNAEEKEVKVYQDGKKIATITEDRICLNWSSLAFNKQKKLSTKEIE